MIDTGPPSPTHSDPHAALEAAYAWWREAGVDLAFGDAPQSWLAQPEAAPDPTAEPPRKAAPPPPPAPRTAHQRALEERPAAPSIGGARADWPQDLENFRRWWMTEPTLADGALSRRIPPAGVTGAALAVLLPQPLAEAGEERFLAAILAACGYAPEQVYIASALAAPAALPDWADLAARGLDAVTRHHLALAAPQRLLVFGRAVAPLLGQTGETARAPFAMDLGASALRVLVAPELAELARSAPRRQRFWDQWLEWTR